MLEQRILLASAMIYSGTGSTDSYLLRAVAGSPSQVQVLLNGSVIDTQTLANVSSITIDTGAGDDVLTVDYINGNPLPSGGMTFNAGSNGAAGDFLNVVGSAAGDAIGIDNRAAAPSSAGIAVADATAVERISVSGASGNDVITIGRQVTASITLAGGAGSDTITVQSTSVDCTHIGGGSAAESDVYNLVAGTHEIGADLGAGGAKASLKVGWGAACNLRATQHLQALSIADSGIVRLEAGNRYIETVSLGIGDGGVLDLNNNNLIVTGGNFAGLSDLRFKGYRDFVTDDASGIISSTGQIELGHPILALFDNAVLNSGTWPFGGGTVAAQAIVGAYTFLGDADLNGMVTPDDYGALDSNAGASVSMAGGMNWFAGDWNFDGVIGPDDLGAVDANLGLSETVAPEVSVTAPGAGATVSGAVTLTADAYDNLGISAVQFYVDGVPLGSPDGAAPFSVVWQAGGVGASHVITAVATDFAGNAKTSAPVNVTVQDTVPPAVSILSPTANANVAGTLNITISASDNIGVAGVRFFIDGVAFGAEDTAAPYALEWNTTGLANGSSHTIYAVARDAAGNLTTSAVTTVKASNGTYNLTVSPGQQLQMMDGLGVNLNSAAWNNGAVVPQLDTLVNTMGASLYRVIVESVSGWEDANDNSDPFVANAAYYNALYETTKFTNLWNTIGYLNARKIPVFVNAMGTIPTWMGGTAISTNMEDEYVEMVATMLDYAVHKKGLKIDFVSPMNEQDLGNPEGPKVFEAQYHRIVSKFLNRLDTLGLGNIQLIGGDTAGNGSSYINEIFTDAAVMAKTYHLAFHDYAGNNFAFDSSVKNSGWAGRNWWVTEFGGGLPKGDEGVEVADDWAYSLQMSQYLYNHISGGASGAAHYDGIDSFYQHHGYVNSNGVIKWTAATNTYAVRKRMYALAQYTKFVRPGMRRVGVSTTVGNVLVLAFVDPASGKFTIVGQNNGTSAASFTGNLGSASASSFELYETTSALSLARQADVAVNNGLFSVTVPAQSIFTLTSPTTPDATPPTAPKNLTASSGYAPINLAWTASTDNVAVSSYNVYRSNLAGFVPSDSTLIATVGTNAFSDSSVTPGTWYYKVMARDAAGNLSAASNEAVSNVTADTSAPTVAITAPSNNATVSNTVTLSASASDDVGVVGVQFLVDGQPAGAEITAGPYTMQWASNSVLNGVHTITAVARDLAGNIKTSAAVNVTVSNSAPANLVAAWGFNEASGASVIDASGHNLTGTITNATRVAGKFGSALSFNGTSSWVTVSSNALLDLTNGMTLEAWVYPTAGGDWRTVIMKQRPGGLAYGMYAYGGAGMPPAGYINKAGTDYSAGGGSVLPLNTWSHLATTFDGSAIRLYVNGTLVGSTAVTGPITTSSDVLRIGGNSVWNEFFQGSIDEVRVYGRALTGAEIAGDMGRAV
ncbi:MAG TPA: Ig-like domain-containing protein [Tepidisphaeraceae bacterium]